MNRDSFQPSSSNASRSIIPLLLLVHIIFAFFIYFSAVPGGSSSLITFIMICVVAVVLAFTDSRYLIQYLLYIWVTAPGVRRMVDYLQENFQAVSPLVVASLAASLTTLIPILRHRIKLETRIIKALGLIALAILYASILGLFRNGIPAVYDMANFGIPILLLVYMSLQKLDTDSRDSHIRSFVTMTVIVAAYGWVQFLFVPAWDAYWVHHTHMDSIGVALPLMLRVFSTLNAPSSAASLFGAALIPMLSVPKWRGIFGWFGVALVAGALAFTLVRAAWITLIVGIVTFILAGTGKQRWASVFRLSIVVVIAALLFPFIPGLKTISNRAETLANLSQDQSFQVRTNGSFLGFLQFLKKPLGQGLGSQGESGKLSSDEVDTSVVNFNDNGFVVVLNTFGLLGAVALFSGLWLLFKSLRHANIRHPKYHEYTKLGLAVFFYSISSLPFGNSLQGIPAVFLFYFVGLALAPTPELEGGYPTNSETLLPLAQRGVRS